MLLLLAIRADANGSRATAAGISGAYASTHSKKNRRSDGLVEVQYVA